MTKGTIIFDLDDTLIYTQKIKSVMKKLVKDNGSNAIDIEKTWQEYTEGNNGHFDLKQYINFLEINYKHNIDKKSIDKFYKSSLKNFLKGNVEKTIITLKKRGYNLLLLSKGGAEFQLVKIKNSGLLKHFKRKQINICQDKADHLKKLKLIKPIYIINDRLKETKMIREIFPDFHYFHVNREDNHKLYEPHEVDMESIDTIEDLLQILN